MMKLNKVFLLTTCVAAGMASSAMAMENRKTMCTYAKDTRIIEVVYKTDKPVPCEVQYTKSSGTKTLWRANNKAGYCENKAAEFVEKQRGWGWSCELVTAKHEDQHKHEGKHSH